MTEKLSTRDFDLTGKVALITGAAGLIGREVADAYAAYGANVILTDLDRSVKSISEQLSSKYPGSKIDFLSSDITSDGSVQQLFESIERDYGRLDILAHLAALDAKFDPTGTVEPARFENYPLSLVEKSMAVNCTGSIRALQAAIRLMLKHGAGNIVLTASTYSLVAPNQHLYRRAGGPVQYKPVDYVATKSMVPNLARYIAVLYASAGIRCNAIVPHGIDNGHSADFRSSFAELSPMQRMCNVSELRGPFVFLASDASSYMTGSTLVVDGGWTAW